MLDPSFNKYRLPLASVERLATGMRWCEGPVYFGDARCLLWSDIPNNRIMRWDEETGARQRLPQALEQRQRQHPRPPGPAGHLRARRAARHPHRVRRHDHRADRQVRRQAAQLAERRGGEVGRLDLVHRSAVRHPRQLRGPQATAPNCRRTSIGSIPRPARATVVARRRSPGPNGLAFSPDEKKLYIVASRDAPDRSIRVYDVTDDGKLANGKRVHPGRAGRHARRLPRRRRRQSVVRLGHGQRRSWTA